MTNSRGRPIVVSSRVKVRVMTSGVFGVPRGMVLGFLFLPFLGSQSLRGSVPRLSIFFVILYLVCHSP